MDSGIGPMTNGIINNLLGQIDNPKIKDYFYQKWINPLHQSLKKYQMIAISAYFLIVILLIVIIYLIIRKG